VGAYNYVGASSAGDGQRQIRPYDAEYQSTKLSDKKTTQGYMAQGNMSLFQGEVNGRVKNDSDRVNKYSSLPNMPYQSPDITMMGKTNSNGGYNLYSNIGIDRNSPEMLDALKSNPYTHSVTNAFR
jgi:hypothetical protein